MDPFIHNFLGKIDYDDNDIKKIWSRLNDKVSTGKSYNLINDLYIAGKHELKKKLKINKRSGIDESTMFKLIFQKFYDSSDKNGIKKKSGDFDEAQLTSVIDDSFNISLDNEKIAIDRINNYRSSDISKDFVGKFNLNSKEKKEKPFLLVHVSHIHL